MNSDKSAARSDNNFWVSKQYFFSSFVINTFMELAQKKGFEKTTLRSSYHFMQVSGLSCCAGLNKI